MAITIFHGAPMRMIARAKNGLELDTAAVIIATEWTILLNKLSHFTEAEIHWKALDRACACKGGSWRGCDFHRKAMR